MPARQNVRVRIAQPRDLPHLVELWGELARIHEQLSAGFALARDWRRAYEDYVAQIQARGDALICVAGDGDRLVGMAVGRLISLPAFFRDRHRGYIQDVYVREAYRGRGIARQMVARVESWLASQGLARIDLTVAADNGTAEAFWENLGYVPYLMYLSKET
jgi:ribosomal protein S18 acetylase RimI-like enzyme